MLEGVLARLLASRLGGFVAGVDEENLKVAVWKGDILLENLTLKPEAFDSLGLPRGIKLKWGRVATFHLSIPWNGLGTMPLSVTLKDVRLVFGPVAHNEGWTEEEARRRRRGTKERVVRERLSFLKANRASSGSQHQDKQSISQRLVSSIFSNIQFHMSKVHIRFEDFHSHEEDSRGICLGLRVNSFKVENESQDNDCVCKNAKASSVALYCDDDSPPLEPTAPPPSTMATHQYLLHPTSASFSIEVRQLPTPGHPKYLMKGHVGRTNVAISREQVGEKDITCIYQIGYYSCSSWSD